MKVVMITALTVETAGALLLATVFVPEFGAEGIFISVFTSVSAFCNAGSDIFGRGEAVCIADRLRGQPDRRRHGGALIIVGGIGFIVIHDLLQYRRTKKLLLHTRIVIVSTVSLILVGMAFTAVCEWNNPFTLGGLSGTGERARRGVVPLGELPHGGLQRLPPRADARHHQDPLLAAHVCRRGAGSTGRRHQVHDLRGHLYDRL